MIKFALVILCFCIPLCANEIVRYDVPLATQYLVYTASLTVSDIDTITNTLIEYEKDANQPSERFYCIYNSSSGENGFIDYNSSELIFSSSTTRSIFNVSSKLDDDSFILSLISDGKSVKLSTIRIRCYDDSAREVKDIVETYIINYREYPLNNNADWYTVQSST